MRNRVIRHFSLYQGPNGFEELRKLVKHGSDFTKEVASVLSERSELETTYAKGLFKLAVKLNKVARDNIGSTANAWCNVSIQMEREAETHRALSLSLTEEVVKPLRNLCENQAKARKTMECQVDKKAKIVVDKRIDEAKLKRQAYIHQRDVERLHGDIERTSSDKELVKIQAKKVRAEEALARADVLYYTSCLAAERSRQEWEASVYDCARNFELMERERLMGFVEAMQRYACSLALVGPSTAGCAERLERSIEKANPTGDIFEIVKRKGTAPNVPEQYLPDVFAEDLQNQMQLDRRKESLEKFLMMVMRDLEVERKGREGVENLARVFQETSKFGDEDAQADVQEKLRQLKQTLAFLEATRYKLQCVLLSLGGQLRPSHPLSAHIEQHRDRQGHPQTILKIPSWIARGTTTADLERTDSQNSDSSEGVHSGGSEGINRSGEGSDFEDGDEAFSDDGDAEPVSERMSENPIYDSAEQRDDVILRTDCTASLRSHNSKAEPKNQESSDHRVSPGSNGTSCLRESIFTRCTVLYDYNASLSDELSLRQGDVVGVLRKSADGWWYGETMKGGTLRRGLFPATYVQEADA
ncbi:nostrin-like isoform X3 [Varroa jacobsoni]|uniref:nostrin-like isoform X3 n=1 Tax=Varroa jacobsoni TaxID=62625 RepID=UPI000BF79974|nr:nostrin-like isoform X3 [Varroa jacobsoni]